MVSWTLRSAHCFGNRFAFNLHHFAIQVINVVAIVAGEENLLGEPSYKYLTADEMRGLGDDSMAIDVTHDEKQRAEVDGGGKGALPPSSVSATMVSERERESVCV